MYIDPMRLVDCSTPFESDQHIAELKMDGIRGILDVDVSTRLYTRHRNEITSRFQEITAAATEAAPKNTVLDGELFIGNTETGAPDFAATMSRFLSKRFIAATPGLTFVAFDILVYKGKNLKHLPGYSKKSAAWLIGVQRGDKIIHAGTLTHGITGQAGKSIFPLLKKLTVRETRDYAYVEPIIRIGVRFRHWTDKGLMRLPVLERIII
ncbi:hypothetical protein ACE41H_21435 [Paenibacillus enshidis]|uniref:ATP-dependent DNA ligase family profile domain-containing protein n=1 Tax=Paenibacillus enshidis TaxID=1458439 RepID=A0ABV5AYN3_9BACL